MTSDLIKRFLKRAPTDHFRESLIIQLIENDQEEIFEHYLRPLFDFVSLRARLFYS